MHITSDVAEEIGKEEIYKWIRQLRHRLSEEDDIITTINDPLVEEAVVLSKKATRDEYGMLEIAKDSKAIYFDLVKKQKENEEKAKKEKIAKSKPKLDFSKLSKEAQELYSEVVINKIAVIDDIARFPEILQESIDMSKKGGLHHTLYNYDNTGHAVAVQGSHGPVSGVYHDPLKIYECLLRGKINQVDGEKRKQEELKFNAANQYRLYVNAGGETYDKMNNRYITEQDFIDNPYNCQYCRKRFKTDDERKQHTRLHGAVM